MKIFIKFILTNLKERKLRTFVMLLSVILSTTLLFVSLSVGESYESAQRKMTIGYAGKARISVKNNDESFISKSEVENFENSGHTAGILKARGMYSKSGYYENIDFVSGKKKDLDAINKPKVIEGSMNNFTGNKIVLPDRFISKFKTKVGDMVPVSIDGQVYKFKLVAICKYDSIFLRNIRGFTALMPFETLSEIVKSDGSFSELLVVPKKGVEYHSLDEEVRDKMKNQNLEITPVYNEQQVVSSARQKSMPFFLISFFTLTISVFIIYSSYKIIISDRMKSIGTFRSIGASQKTITKILLIESFIYGVAGGLLGIPFGYFTLRLLLGNMSDSVSSFGIEIPVVVSPLSIIIPFVIAVSVSILGALIPIRKASRLAVKDIILGTIEEEYVSNTKRMIIGTLLLFISIIIPRIAKGNALTISGGISLLTLLLSAIMTIPLFINLFSKLMEKVYGRLFGNEGKLAARNLKDNRNINQNATLLFISISAIIVISVVGNFVNVYITDVFRGATLDGFSQSNVDHKFIDQVRRLDTVSDVLPLYVLDDEVKINGSKQRVEATDNIKKFSEMMAINYAEKNDKIKTFDNHRFVLINKETQSSLGVKIGQKVKLSDSSKTENYTVVGSFESRADDVDVVIPSKFAIEDFESTNFGFFAYKAKKPEDVMIQIRNMYGDRPHWSRTVVEFTNDAKETVSSFLEPMKNLTYFILVLASVGVINNLLINYIQKRRSIAMYKSVGLSNFQNLKMTLIESISVGIVGAALAVIISYLEIRTVFLVAGPKISMTPDLDVSTFAYSAFLGIGITLAGSLIPILRNRKMKIIEEIKFD